MEIEVIGWKSAAAESDNSEAVAIAKMIEGLSFIGRVVEDDLESNENARPE